MQPEAFRGPMLLLSWWAIVSRVRISWKLAGYCLGTTVLFVLALRECVGYVTLRQTPWTSEDWLSCADAARAVVQAPVALLLLAASRLPHRWRLRLTTPFRADPNCGTWQCTLGDLLLVTFALAATLGLLLWTAPYPAWLLELPKIWLAAYSDVIFAILEPLQALGGVLVTLAAAWLVLGTSRLRWRLLTVIPVLLWPPVWVALVVTIGWEEFASMDLAPLTIIVDGLPPDYRSTLSLFAALTVSFVVVRLAGCRLHAPVALSSDGTESAGADALFRVRPARRSGQAL